MHIHKHTQTVAFQPHTFLSVIYCASTACLINLIISSDDMIIDKCREMCCQNQHLTSISQVFAHSRTE